jgi:hypothetical protein
MVLWWDEGRSAREMATMATLAGVSEPTARLWPPRFAADGLVGLLNGSHPGIRGAGRKSKWVPGPVRGAGFWRSRG